MDWKTKIIKAKIQLLSEQPFFGYLLIYLPIVEDESVLTLATDGKKIYVNPDYINKLSLSEVKAVLAHEVLHCALQHLWRRGKRIPELWNVATDFAVNIILHDCGFKLPYGVLIDRRFRGKCAEEIYEILRKSAKVINISSLVGRLLDDHSKWGKGGVDNKSKSVKGDKETEGIGKKAEDLSKEWVKRFAEAVNIARIQGKLPAGLEKIVDIILSPPKLKWRELIERELISVKPSDYTWYKPNKAWLAGSTDFWLPGVERKNRVDVVVAIDTSGSITDKEYEEFVREVYHLCRKHDARLTVLLCDAVIQAVYKNITNPNEVIEKLKKRIGYGGTDFRPVFKWIERNAKDCKMLIYFTDTFGEYPKKKPRYRVLWVVPKSIEKIITPPFGRVIRM